MQKTILAFIILFSYAAIAQDKTIRGFIYDDYTNYRISGVEINPTINDSTVLSNEKGKFKVDLPPRYKDTIVFSHPDYYPFVKRVSSGDAMKLQFIRLIPRTFRLDTVCYSAYRENMLIIGEVVDYYKGKPVEGAIIRMEDNKIIAYTNIEGDFKTSVPRTNRTLIVNRELFAPEIVPVNLDGKGDYELRVKLKKSILTKADTAWKDRKNLLTFSVLELLNGGIGLRYERFIKRKHSVGLHATSYFFGFSWPMLWHTMDDNRFTGIKVAPFYHFYVLKHPGFAGYAEIKPIIAYFDFYSLDYAMKYEPEYEKNVSTYFWTGGIGVAWGWLFFPHRSNFTVGLSLGLQIFPWNVPETITDENGSTWEINKTWWYFGGPGGVFEFKFTIGGIF